MNELMQARQAALNTQAGSPVYQVAAAVCQIRTMDPHGHSIGGGMMNWQAVIMEQLLLELMPAMQR